MKKYNVVLDAEAEGELLNPAQCQLLNLTPSDNPYSITPLVYPILPVKKRYLFFPNGNSALICLLSDK